MTFHSGSNSKVHFTERTPNSIHSETDEFFNFQDTRSMLVLIMQVVIVNFLCFGSTDVRLDTIMMSPISILKLFNHFDTKNVQSLRPLINVQQINIQYVNDIYIVKLKQFSFTCCLLAKCTLMHHCDPPRNCFLNFTRMLWYR